MTLLDLLTVISFLTPISSAFGAAKHNHIGMSGYILAAVLGLVLGVLSAACFRGSAMSVAPRLEAMKKPMQSTCTVLYLCLCIVWPFLGVFAGAWAIKSVMGWLA